MVPNYKWDLWQKPWWEHWTEKTWWKPMYPKGGMRQEKVWPHTKWNRDKYNNAFNTCGSLGLNFNFIFFFVGKSCLWSFGFFFSLLASAMFLALFCFWRRVMCAKIFPFSFFLWISRFLFFLFFFHSFFESLDFNYFFSLFGDLKFVSWWF